MILIKRTTIPAKLEAESKKELRDILVHFEKRKRKEGFVFKAYKMYNLGTADLLPRVMCRLRASSTSTETTANIRHDRVSRCTACFLNV
jgi:hypothetical protein